jgi:hypothetical protein
MDLRRLIREHVPEADLVAGLMSGRGPAKDAGEQLFMQAPSLGLQYATGAYHPPVTPLLGAGERRQFDHPLQGPLFGRLGGPTCLLSHYTYETVRDENANDYDMWPGNPDNLVYDPHRFTICAAEVGEHFGRLDGVFVRPRLSVVKLEDDWLAVGAPRHRVTLESARFNEIYDLHRSDGQDEVALRELFSPTFTMWMQEHPLKPGFECAAGSLVVFIRGYETAPTKITYLQDATREIARRIERQLAEDAAA